MNEMPKFILYENQFIPVDMLEHIYYHTNLTDDENGRTDVKLPNRLILIYRKDASAEEESRQMVTIFGKYADDLFKYLKARSVDVDEL